MPFRNPIALLGLLSIIPLIVLYLIRPRPKEVRFPSTIFLEVGVAERSAVVNRLIKDPLFWIQLIVLASLSLAAAGPYTTSPGTPASHLVVVMDVSASMESSFPQAVKMAEAYMPGNDKVSIVMADSIPILALDSGSYAEARDTLARISPRSVSADLSGAMLLGSGLLGSDGGNILVVSDFKSWLGDDPDSTRKQIENDNVGVVFANSDGGGDNVAIVGGWNVESGTGLNHTALIHNYGQARTVPIVVSGPGGSSTSSVSLDSGADYYFSFNSGPGINTITLDLQDAIRSDNRAYIYQPQQSPRNVLYMGERGPALVALQSLPNARVSTSGDYSNFDLVVVSRNATTDAKLNRYIDGGGKVVYVGYDPKDSPEYLPVRITGAINSTEQLWARSPEFGKDLHFDEIGIFGYLDASTRRGSESMIEAGGVPVLAYWTLGKGTVIYDGLDYSSDFYQRPEYPIFWYLMINWLTGVPDISESNHLTGEVIPLGRTLTVDTPYGPVTTSSLLLDEVGTYTYQGRTLAANMYDPKESDLSVAGARYDPGEFKSNTGRESLVENDVAPWVIALAALMIVLELAIIRWRREV
ncbi:MAG TPA: BatA domain-containing protein [Methanotrichaceae archaeon]|nr:BatA domain-containing protein [Methanotrichaceae archaeon]